MRPPFHTKLRRLACCGLVVLLQLAGCRPADGPATLRLAAFSPSHGWTVRKVLEPWVEELNDSFAGEATLLLFSGGALGRHPHAQLRMVVERIVDIAYILPSYTPGAFPDNDLLEVPLLFPGAQAASLASWRLLQRGVLRGYGDLKVLALYTTSPYYLHLASPIDSIDDLRGRKIRVTGSLQARTVAALGAIPIGGIAASELADSIDRGLLDGTLLSWDLVHIYGVTPVTSFHIEFPLGFTNLMIAMNRESYAALPAAVRSALDRQSGEPLIRRFVAANAELAEIGYQSALRSGEHEFLVLSPGQEREWRSRLLPLIEERKSRVPQTGDQMSVLHEILADISAEQSSSAGAIARESGRAASPGRHD